MARVIFGMQPVREAIRKHGSAVERVLVAAGPSRADAAGQGRVDALERFAADQGIRVERVTSEHLARLAHGSRHQNVAAYAPELDLLKLDELRPVEDSPLLVLDGITDPQNFGAAIRSAVALGSGALLWAEHGSAPLTPATFRASAGAVEHARLFLVASLRTALGRLGAQGMRSVALEPAAPLTLAEIDLRGSVAIVVGAEDDGVSRAVRRACPYQARLPMTNKVQSLNASVAAAVALYEAARQRQSGAQPTDA
jgi:23S rRNA (guanosine2251-2'-O)-methyltransferase